MEGRERGEVVDRPLDVGRDDGRAVEPVPAVDDAVPDRLRLRQAADRVERRADRRFVVGRAAGLPDPLDGAGGVHVARPRVDELVLQRRGPGVQHEDRAVHGATAAVVAGSVCAWMAVMAIVFTMSRTRAPLDRSLIGLFRPCSTGPIASAFEERCTAL